MKADPAAKLQSAMRGGISTKTGVAGVTGVAGGSATCTKSLKLQWLRQLRVKSDKVANDEIRGVAGDVASPPEPDDAEIVALLRQEADEAAILPKDLNMKVSAVENMTDAELEASIKQLLAGRDDGKPPSSTA
jgi:hypothetical protein